MQRRKTVLAASTLLLAAACTFNPKVDPNKLDCIHDNGCPSGYRCVDVTVEKSGFCCNNPGSTLCRRPGTTSADDGSAAGDARPTDGFSDGIGRTDGSTSNASDGSAEKPASDANATDRATSPDSGPPVFDGATDRAAAQMDGLSNSDAIQPDVTGVFIQQDAEAQQDTASLSDSLIPLPPDALVQQDAAALSDGLAPNDALAAQDSPLDVPVGPIPDAAPDLSSDAPLGAGPQITSIEGTGTAAAVAPRTEDLTAWKARVADRRPASKRISSSVPVLEVTGNGLGGVTQATLKGQSGQGEHVMSIGAASATRLTLGWPSTLAAGGLFILSLTAPTGTAEAEVFFLQGEAGLQGTTGLQGAKGDKGDPGDSLFSCSAGTCSTSNNISVGGLFTVTGGLTNGSASLIPPPKTVVLTTLSAADLADTTMFSATGLGAGVYLGWAICNGNNATTNLTAKFPRMIATGAGATGGSDAAHTHTMGNHTHDARGTMYAAIAPNTNGSGLVFRGGAITETFTPSHRYTVVTENESYTTLNGMGVPIIGATAAPSSNTTSGTDGRPAYYELVPLCKL